MQPETAVQAGVLLQVLLLVQGVHLRVKGAGLGGEGSRRGADYSRGDICTQ